MARAATTSDAFNAVAEPHRRAILTLLTTGEMSVNDIADALELRQPQASKHLKVLKEVDLVRVRGSGQKRLYQLNARGLKPVHEWVSQFEKLWNERFDRLDEYLKELQQNTREEKDE